MKTSFDRRALLACVAATTLSGCGALRQAQGDTSPAGISGVLPQSRTIAARVVHGGSWMLPEAKGQDLLYVSNDGAGDVYVFSYPKGKLVGTLTGFDDPNGECLDAKGDVFITNSAESDIVEYAHGGTSAIATLSDPGEGPLGCAIDPTTGNLAVTNACTASCRSAGDLVIYKRAKGSPRSYSAPGTYFYGYCGYDNSGDLFLDGNSANKDSTFQFDELLKGSKKPEKISGLKRIGFAGGVQWDGKYVAVADALEDAAAIYRVQVSGSRGKIVSTIELEDSLQVLQFWIQGNKVIDPDQSADNIKFYDYPGGGSPTKTITGSFDSPNGAVVSPAQ